MHVFWPLSSSPRNPWSRVRRRGQRHPRLKGCREVSCSGSLLDHGVATDPRGAAGLRTALCGRERGTFSRMILTLTKLICCLHQILFQGKNHYDWEKFS